MPVINKDNGSKLDQSQQEGKDVIQTTRILQECSKAAENQGKCENHA